MKNIVQLEFFHVGGKTSATLDSVMQECTERIEDGSPIKTVVRLRDETGKLTKAVQELKTLNRRYVNLMRNLDAVPRFLGLMFGVRNQMLAAKINRRKRRMRRLAVASLRRAAKLLREIAVENPDHSFRFAHKNELHEILESAGKATGVWIFVFQPNHLLADKNTSVAYTM